MPDRETNACWDNKGQKSDNDATLSPSILQRTADEINLKPVLINSIQAITLMNRVLASLAQRKSCPLF